MMQSDSRSCVGALDGSHLGLPYAFRENLKPSVLERIASKLVIKTGLVNKSRRSVSRILPHIHRHAERMAELSDDAIMDTAIGLRSRLKRTQLSPKVAGECFALIREVAGRKLGMRHFDVQLVGGWSMLNGLIAEMETGEGKTLTATLAASTAALAGIPVHVITVNDYLAQRDAEILRPVYESLGLTVSAALADMSDDERREAYACDVTYTTNKQVAFDHLRDRIQLRGHNSQLGMRFIDRQQGLLLRGLHFAIIDEADSVLVDEAVTPLVISRPGKPTHEKSYLVTALDLAGTLKRGEHYKIDAPHRRLTLEPDGQQLLEKWSEDQAGLWKNTRYREHLVAQALRALHLFERDRHYLVQDEKVKIIDEFTGRVMEDRSWEQGLHQLIEVKENCELTGELETIGRISYQRFFSRYRMLGGMSGTVQEVSDEIKEVYRLGVVKIPTHRKSRRKRYRSQLSKTAEHKWDRVIETIIRLHGSGRPVLVGTRSVGASEYLGDRLSKLSLPHRVLNARQDQQEAEIVAEAGQMSRITVATNMAGRGTDIKLPEEVAGLDGLHVILTERHEARRIDRQLFGRCGRQGDPGSIQEIIAIEDDLTQAYLSKFERYLAGFCADSGLQFLGWLFVDIAQKRAQSLSARARVKMLKLDEYLGNVLAFSGRLE